MLRAAKVRHLCYSVDYKRGVLEILLNSQEALIMLSTFIRFFRRRVSCYIHAQRGVVEKQLTGTVLAQSLNMGFSLPAKRRVPAV